ncbi:hypothetical protein AAV98_15240 [Bacillus sp. CHD6a]|nr:hypothetical protein AAV98_15240 [Bacillus sp. CHD6a]
MRVVLLLGVFKLFDGDLDRKIGKKIPNSVQKRAFSCVSKWFGQITELFGHFNDEIVVGSDMYWRCSVTFKRSLDI